tara:strand:- start:243 stop:548 length:306 start_codon:yes stop_codon:yes gene_type:complete
MNLHPTPKMSEAFRRLQEAAAKPIELPKDTLGKDYWTMESLEKLCSLRALHAPLAECAEILERSINSCGGACHKYQLYGIIERKRRELIQVVKNGNALGGE